MSVLSSVLMSCCALLQVSSDNTKVSSVGTTLIYIIITVCFQSVITHIGESMLQ
jgi:hypothetical protein